MLTTRSQLRLDNAICNLRRAMVNPKFTTISAKIGNLLVHGVNGSRPLQDVFTADSIASSRVESINSFSKSFGLDGTISLLRSVLVLKKLIQSQELSCHKYVKKSYPFVSDTGFSNLLSDELQKLVTDEVLEHMYNEYKLSQGKRYCVTLVSDGKYDVVFNDKTKLHDTHHVEHNNDGDFHCWCCVRTGFPCRHVFAVAEALNQKIAHTSVNSRFFLVQSQIDFHAENSKKLEVVMQSLAKKKEIYGEFFLAKRFMDISTNIEDGVDVVEKFKTALEMFGIKESDQSTVRSVSDEGTYEALNALPLGSESPCLEEEEMIEICTITGETVKAPESINQADMVIGETEEVKVISSQPSQPVHQEPNTQHTNTNEAVEVVVCDNENVADDMCATVCVEKEGNESNLVVDSERAISEEVNLLDEMDFTEKCTAMKKALHEYLKRAPPDDIKQIYAHFNKVIHEMPVIQCRVKSKRIPSTGEFPPKKKNKQSGKQTNGDNNEKQNNK